MGFRIDFLTTLVKEKIVSNAYQLCNLRLVLALRWSCVFIVKCRCAFHQRKYTLSPMMYCHGCMTTDATHINVLSNIYIRDV